MAKRYNIQLAGFTYIEALLVLFITCLVLALSLQVPRQRFERIQLESALKQMESQISLLQQECFVLNSAGTIYFSGRPVNKIAFNCYHPSAQAIPSVHLPKSYYFKGTKRLIFNPKGSTSYFFTVSIEGPDTFIQYRFQLGAGRFYRDEAQLPVHPKERELTIGSQSQFLCRSFDSQ